MELKMGRRDGKMEHKVTRCGGKTDHKRVAAPWTGMAALWTTVFLAAMVFAVTATGCFQETDSGPEPILTTGALADVLYEPARRIVSRSCADCHAAGGKHEKHIDAWGHAIRLDTHQEWLDGRADISVRLDPIKAAEQDPPVDVMPLATFPLQLTPAERDTLLQWIARGSPNTASGLAEPE